MHHGTQDRSCAHAGSELCLAIDAAKEIEASGKKARVVSAVCWELFEDQDESYKNSVLPPDVTARVCNLHRPETRCLCRVFLRSPQPCWRFQSLCVSARSGCLCLGPHSNHRRGRSQDCGLRGACSGAGVRGGWLHLWVGEVRGPQGQVHRGGPLWCLRPRPHPLQGVWHHQGGCRGCRPVCDVSGATEGAMMSHHGRHVAWRTGSRQQSVGGGSRSSCG